MGTTRPKLFRPNPLVRRAFEAHCKRALLSEKLTLESLMLYATEAGDVELNRLRIRLSDWLNEQAVNAAEVEQVERLAQAAVRRQASQSRKGALKKPRESNG
jgi:hypothetical protein